MDAELLYYTSGEDVQLGDRVQYRGTFATVVVVSDGETYQLAPGYEDYAGAERGVMICAARLGLSSRKVFFSAIQSPRIFHSDIRMPRETRS